MSRIRSIHPGQWTDEDFVALSAFARLLALAIRNEADDNGVFEWKPLQLKMRLFPADQVDVGLLLDELEEYRHVAGYQANGRRYGVIRNFNRWQRPRRPSALYPMPCDGDVEDEFLIIEPSAECEAPETDGRQPSLALVDPVEADMPENAAPAEFPTLSDNVRPYLVSSNGNRKRSERSARASPRGSFAEGDFEKWWKVYPNPVAEPLARRLFPAALGKASLDTLIAAAERYRAEKPPDRLWCNPATWLRNERWNDRPAGVSAYSAPLAVAAGPRRPHGPPPERL